MTTYYRTEIICVICGSKSTHNQVGSTNAIGSSDLDTRPPAMKRWTINSWVQVCPFCGYCAQNISEGYPEVSRVVKSNSYQKQLRNPGYPELANSFLCLAMINENSNKFVKAGWACIHAAWACDDADSPVGAQKCRKRAVTLLQGARENGQNFAEETGTEEAMIADLLRRSGQFELAQSYCKEGLNKKPGKVVTEVLLYEMLLIKKMDDACHTVAEAMGES